MKSAVIESKHEHTSWHKIIPFDGNVRGQLRLAGWFIYLPNSTHTSLDNFLCGLQVTKTGFELAESTVREVCDATGEVWPREKVCHGYFSF